MSVMKQISITLLIALVWAAVEWYWWSSDRHSKIQQQLQREREARDEYWRARDAAERRTTPTGDI